MISVSILERLTMAFTGGTADDARESDIVLAALGRATIEAAAPHHVRPVRQNVFDRLSGEQVPQLAGITESILAHHEPE